MSETDVSERNKVRMILASSSNAQSSYGSSIACYLCALGITCSCCCCLRVRGQGKWLRGRTAVPPLAAAEHAELSKKDVPSVEAVELLRKETNAVAAEHEVPCIHGDVRRLATGCQGVPYTYQSLSLSPFVFAQLPQYRYKFESAASHNSACKVEQVYQTRTG